jgi:hypothetical protein
MPWPASGGAVKSPESEGPAMMLLGFATLGFLGYCRNAGARVAAWSEARGTR